MDVCCSYFPINQTNHKCYSPFFLRCISLCALLFSVKQSKPVILLSQFSPSRTIPSCPRICSPPIDFFPLWALVHCCCLALLFLSYSLKILRVAFIWYLWALWVRVDSRLGSQSRYGETLLAIRVIYLVYVCIPWGTKTVLFRSGVRFPGVNVLNRFLKYCLFRRP